MYEELDEPIAVIALYMDGHQRPLRFRWNGRVYRIARITGHWVVQEGANRHRHYAVVCEKSNVFEISYDPKDLGWRLRSVYLDG